MRLGRLVTVGVCLIGGATAVEAQQALTLADATERALAKNHAIRVERDQVEAATARSRAAVGAYDMQLRVEITGRHHRDPVNSLFSGAPAGSPAPSQNTFGSTLTLSRLMHTGAVASATTSIAREGTDGVFSPFAPAYTSALGVELQQPLLRNRATDSSRTAVLLTALDRNRSGAALEQQAQETVADVEQAYWSLVAARRDLEVRSGSRSLAEQQRLDTQARIDAKTAAASDLAQPTAEVERRRGDLFAAQEAVARAERALKLLILDDLNDPLWSVALHPADSPEPAPVVIDIAAALAEAGRNRAEIAELKAEGSQQDLEVALARNGLKPKLDLVAGYSVRGFAGDRELSGFYPADFPISLPSSLSGGVGNSWSNLFDRKFPDAVVGLSFEMPIGNREARGRIAAAEADRRRVATTLAGAHQRIAAEVLNAGTALETAAGRMQAARAGLVAAEIQLRAEQDRFAAGLTTNFLVLTRQNDLALAQLAEIAAQTDYRKAQTELARATGSLLRDRNIRIDNQN